MSLRVKYTIKKITDIIGALQIFRKLQGRDLWTRAQIANHQQTTLQMLIAHAVDKSPFYREFYQKSGITPKTSLQDLPILTKQNVMEHFDDMVTDPKLKLSDLHHFLQTVQQDDHYLGKYRVISTSGSTGAKGVFVFNRQEWRVALAGTMRCMSLMAIKPRLFKKVKVTTLAAHHPQHITYLLPKSMDLGFYKVQHLQVTTPLAKLVSDLNEFQPDFLQSYPSFLNLMADEQKNGTLKIDPKYICTGAEIRTDAMTKEIKSVWKINPHETYGMTELGGMSAYDCSLHQGLHIFEDLFLLEVVDEQNRPVPAGTPGHKILVTNLFNQTLPLIRYEISDMITLSPNPCPCGSPFRMIQKIEGRNDDILYFHGKTAQWIPIHPIHFQSLLQGLPEIREYQIIQDEDLLTFRLAVKSKDGSFATFEKNIRQALQKKLDGLEALCPAIKIEFVDRLNRSDLNMGKMKVVQSNVKKPV